MKKAFCTLSLLLSLTTVVMGQATTPQLLLDVKAAGFKVDPAGEHNYLRVYDNGLVEFEDYKASLRAFHLYRSHLSKKALASLEDQLDTFTVSDIAASYPLQSPMRRIVRQLKITIPQPNGFQFVEIIAGGASPPPEAETKPLIDLLCTIEKMRRRARLRLIDLRWC